MKFTKSYIMGKAWLIARTAANLFGGKPKEFFSGSLKMSWDFARKASLKDDYMSAFKEMYYSWARGVRCAHRADENSFKVLGLPTVATKQQIKQAYKRLAFVNHPDRGGNHHTFIHVKTAYEKCLEKF